MISIFTPTNNTTWIKEAWDSLRDQPVPFEWLIGLNGNADSTNIPNDEKIKIFNLSAWSGVGAAKNELCNLANGDILLELDHDDILAENALLYVEQAFRDPQIGFVYSDCAEWIDATGESFVYSSEYGWENYPCEIRGRKLLAMSSFEANARTLCQILYAPNHLRAWRRDVYNELGGHDKTLKVADDFDLIARTYLVTKFKHIKKALYGYRRRSDGGNTWLQNVNLIQELCGQGKDNGKPAAGQPMSLRDKYLHKLVERECELNNLPKVDIGGGIFGNAGWTTLDISGNPDIQHDVFGTNRLPFEDNSVGAFRAFDFLEHGIDEDAFWLMEEIYRCLAPGGWFLSRTPHALGIGASCDPSHKSRWDERRFLYWCHKDLRPFLKSAYPAAAAEFLPVRLYKENVIMGPHPWRFDVPYLVADLVVSKGKRLPK
jgi:glycosyltransferase involved in cell wall biosynthesis